MLVGSAVFAGRIESRNLERDVAVAGSGSVDVPGSLPFRVLPPLGGGEPSMSVGVGTSSPTADVDCRVFGDDSRTDADGTGAVAVRRARASEVFVDRSSGSDISVVADDLEPGSYVATCRWSGEPSGEVTFGVGRVLTTSEAISLLGPVLGLIAAVGFGLLLGTVGLVLVVVAVVRRRRAERGAEAQPPSAPLPPSAAPPVEQPPDQRGWRPPPGAR